MLFWASLAHFIAFGLLCPVRAPLSHFILLGLLYAFLLLNSISPVLSLGLYYAVSGFLGSFYCFQAPLSHFFLLGILGPFHHFRAPLSHLSSFVPFYSFRHPRPIPILYSHGPLLSLLGFPDPNYHILYFWGLWAFH